MEAGALVVAGLEMRCDARLEMVRKVRSAATGTGREFASAEVLTVYSL